MTDSLLQDMNTNLPDDLPADVHTAPKMPVQPPIASEQSSGSGNKVMLMAVMGVVGVLVGGAIAGIGVYTMQKNKMETEITNLQTANNTAIKQIQTQLADAQKSLTEKDAALTEATAPVVPPALTFVQDPVTGTFDIKDHDKIIKSLIGDPKIPMRAHIVAQTTEAIFIQVQPATADATLDKNYLQSRGNVYKYTPKDSLFSELTTDTVTEEDIAVAQNGTMLAYRDGSDIVVRNLNTNKDTKYPLAVPGDKADVGDLIFSTSGTKIAYATIAEDKGKKIGSVYILDTTNNITTKLTEGDKRAYHLFRWLSDLDTDLITYFFPL